MNGVVHENMKHISLVVNGKNQDLCLTKALSRGGFGTVWLAQSCSTTLVAKEEVVTDRTKSQTRIYNLRHLSNPFIVDIYGSVATNEFFYTVMDYFPLGSLRDVMKTHSFSAFMRCRFMLDIARGMEYLHSQNVFHYNLKPENVLVASIDPDAKVLCRFVSFVKSLQCLLCVFLILLSCQG